MKKVISTVILFVLILTIGVQVKKAQEIIEDNTEHQQRDVHEFVFIDKEKQESIQKMIDEIQNSETLKESFSNTKEKQKRGKATVAAKIAVKAMKAALNKMGKKTYEKIANATGLQLVGMHWKGINKLLDFVANSGEQIQTALEKALKKWGWNSTIAHWTAKTIVFVVF